jgi:excisionase family DNA binding protein
MAARSRAASNWLGAPAAAQYLGIRQRTLYRLIDTAGLPAYHAGRVLRLRREDLDAWLETQRVKPGELTHLYAHGRVPEE